MSAINHTNTEIWIQIPPNGKRCPITGLSHGRFYRLLAAAGGAIRSVSLKEEGQNRATRLVDRASLLTYLDRLANEQQQRGARA